MFYSIKKWVCVAAALALTACAADESAFLHPKLYYPENLPAVVEDSNAQKVVIFGQSSTSNNLGMGAFISAPKKVGGAYYRAFISSTENIPAFYAQCKTIGDSRGYSYFTNFVPVKKYEFGKYYQVSCEQISIKSYKFAVKEADKATYEQEMSGGKQQREVIKNQKGEENDANSVHLYVKKSEKNQYIQTTIIAPFFKLTWAGIHELHLKGNASIIQVECTFPQNKISPVINVTGDFQAGHSYELACTLSPELIASVTFKEINNP